MPNFRFGDIVSVKFPFTDYTGFKLRPAVIVSSPRYNRERPEVLAMPLTSQLRHGDTFGTLEIKDWQAAGLQKPSVIKPIIAPCLKDRIQSKIGHLSKGDKEDLRACLASILSPEV